MQTNVAILIVAGLVLAAILVAIAAVDFRRQVIPDPLNLALAVSGLGFQLIVQPDSAAMQLLVAALTLAVFWVLRRGHFLLTGRIGLGLGDVKMLAAAALWINPLLLPVLLFIASAAALLFVGGQVVAAGPAAARMRVPFGPFVALGLGLSWMLEQSVGLNLGMP
ncbi:MULTISPECIES: A24 family peptidase [unclassified Mesorhizobium]|uniref:prepilin peptidase n=1 Tax=unclassified Mesorhizobium TaxID=325217 RepID=UPI001091B90B|nr:MULTISPECIES: A24 family peptidase [unclassified Mesorhizobium]TGP85423.1 prepilin peptidase [Mesorhizobium sp. M8A.F.Ca.ET.218.01.1.1]TGT14471.1 prepilin peptidase [Mesorhizobium sp. M8A.F.Ca.ET.213.01.1.1]